jgi:hypothetical protein
MWKFAKYLLGLDYEILVGSVQKIITIYAHKNDAKLWHESANMENGEISCSIFQNSPVLYIIEECNEPTFPFSIDGKIIQCVFERNMNVYHNNCIVRQSNPIRDITFKGVLNYPVELVLAITTNQTIRIKGFWIDEIFHITALSNYPI